MLLASITILISILMSMLFMMGGITECQVTVKPGWNRAGGKVPGFVSWRVYIAWFHSLRVKFILHYKFRVEKHTLA
jgi:hypothetical protein